MGGWVKASSNGTLATGTISIPDCVQAQALGTPCPPPPPGVPAGADIVAAFLYWVTVEKDKNTLAGQNGFFNGYAISGTVLGNQTAPTSWSPGGCTSNTGNSNTTTTMRAYRADVRPYLPVDANGNIQANGSFTVNLADSGSNGNTTPFTLGASLVIIYRVLNPPMSFKAIVLYDGAAAPSNTSSTFAQPIIGFYQPAGSPVAKITHIAGNGQQNKSETVSITTMPGNVTTPLLSLYSSNGVTLPPFPGIYNGSWDNVTWSVGLNGTVPGFDTAVTATIAPTKSNGNCVDWGAIIFSTTVQDTDGDSLPDAWENSQGYIDAKSGNWVALPGASPTVKDIFVEVDYLTDLDGSAGAPPHSHLPKEAALDMVGNAFKNAPVDCANGTCQGVNVHFDLGAGIYQGDPYVISYPLPAPPAGVNTFPNAGGNAISESAVLCTDGATLCQFPGQAAVTWKGGFQFVRDNNATVPNSNPPMPLLGNFQPGRGPSYHYVLFGHSLGEARSSWSTAANVLSDPTFPRLVSIVNSGTTATVTLHSPAPPQGILSGILKPGDCPNSGFPPGCSDANANRVTVGGALGQPALNGTYTFNNPQSGPPDANGVITTTFTIATTNTTPNTTPPCLAAPCVADGSYTFTNEPQLGVAYGGPTSSSGHSDFRGGADSAVTFGLWGADDARGCQPDPSVALSGGQAYCNNEVGSAQQQAGTLMHEVGHTLTLTHGGTYYRDPQNQSVPTYELNCKSNFLSVMNYMFQVRGFPDLLADGTTHPIDFSGQTLPNLSEAMVSGDPLRPGLNETLGIGSDLFSPFQPAAHLTRWYAPPNALDNQVGRFATFHCDGTPLKRDASGNIAEPLTVRLDGANPPAPMVDWNNDLIVPDTIEPVAWQDVNYNGSTSGSQDLPFSGFNDWQAVPGQQPIDLRQIGARAGTLGFSGSGGTTPQFGGGGGAPPQFGGGGGAPPQFGGGGGAPPQFGGGGGTPPQFGGGGGAPPQFGGGGGEQDEDTTHSTADAPTNLGCTMPQGGVPGCVSSSGSFIENAKSVPLTWTAPTDAQTRKYSVFRAVGSFPTLASVKACIAANSCVFANIANITSPTPPSTTFTDPNVKNNVTYTYFVTDTNKQGATSDASDPPLVVTIKF